MNSSLPPYLNVWAVATNFREGADLSHQAAMQGNADAEGKLSYCHAFRHGVPKDLAEAYEWINLAGEPGHPNAALVGDALSKNIPPEAIAEGFHRDEAYVSRPNAFFDEPRSQ